MITMTSEIKDVIIHTIDDFVLGDVIEFINPVSGRFGVGKFIKVIKRRTGDRHTEIELKTSSGKEIITEKNIRWDRTMFHKKTQKEVNQYVTRTD